MSSIEVQSNGMISMQIRETYLLNILKYTRESVKVIVLEIDLNHKHFANLI